MYKDLIKKFLKKRKFSAHGFAETLKPYGISQRTFYRILEGETDPRLSHILIIFKLLKIPDEEIIKVIENFTIEPNES